MAFLQLFSLRIALTVCPVRADCFRRLYGGPWGEERRRICPVMIYHSTRQPPPLPSPTSPLLSACLPACALCYSQILTQSLPVEGLSVSSRASVLPRPRPAQACALTPSRLQGQGFLQEHLISSLHIHPHTALCHCLPLCHTPPPPPPNGGPSNAPRRLLRLRLRLRLCHPPSRASSSSSFHLPPPAPRPFPRPLCRRPAPQHPRRPRAP